MTAKEHIASTFVETDNFKFHHECADEIERLRKWQQEALPWLSYASDRYWDKNHHHNGVGRNNDLDRLIAEAEGEQNA